MLTRYSSRKKPLNESFLNQKFKNARSYDRIAGYFTSSIFEIAGESLDQIDGKIRVVCNSSQDVRDVETAVMARNALRKEWCSSKPEEIENASKRFRKLYDWLSSAKLEVRVLPDERFGLIHGKAGVITYRDGSQTSFLGSVNESISAWKLNYELM